MRILELVLRHLSINTCLIVIPYQSAIWRSGNLTPINYLPLRRGVVSAVSLNGLWVIHYDAVLSRTKSIQTNLRDRSRSLYAPLILLMERSCLMIFTWHLASISYMTCRGWSRCVTWPVSAFPFTRQQFLSAAISHLPSIRIHSIHSSKLMGAPFQGVFSAKWIQISI